MTLQKQLETSLARIANDTEAAVQKDWLIRRAERAMKDAAMFHERGQFSDAALASEKAARAWRQLADIPKPRVRVQAGVSP